MNSDELCDIGDMKFRKDDQPRRTDIVDFSETGRRDPAGIFGSRL